MIAPRFAPAVCLLVLFALVPTWIHSYSGELDTDGLTSEAIPSMLGLYRGTETERGRNWGQRRFGSGDWIERTYTDGARQVRLTVVRSLDAKTLYHHPELAIAYGTGFVGSTIERLPDRPSMPVHVLKPAPGESTVAMYVLQYEDRFVESPILFQVRTAGELLFSGRKAMTLFFTTESNVLPGSGLERLASATVLTSAVDAFASQQPRHDSVAEAFDP